MWSHLSSLDQFYIKKIRNKLQGDLKMATLIRSIHNTSSTDSINLGIAGFDPTESLIVGPSATVDLLSIMTADSLHAMQAQLAALVAAGEATTALTIDSSVLYNTAYTAVQSAPSTIGTFDSGVLAADLGVTTIATPAVTGMYLVCYYAEASVDAPSDVPQLFLNWTDDVAAQSIFTNPFGGGTNFDGTHSDGADSNARAIPIYAVAGSPITTHSSGGTYTTLRYIIHATVTKI